VHRFDYEDAARQRLSENIAFTFADYAAADDRHAERFACVARADWADAMVPLADFLELDAAAAEGKVPYVWVLDEGDVLYRAVVEAGLVEAARRCRDLWRGLQELGGINNSHVRAVLAREREAWEAAKEAELEALRKEAEKKAKAAAPAPAAAADASAPAEVPTPESPPEATPEAAAQAAPAAAEAPEAPEAKPEPGAPYIETPRCTTCDECTQINNRMFAYDDNKQAYIADASAGTYRDLVTAAESCQVAIIHPGKPLNPDEPGLDDLIARAEPFH